MNTLYYGDNLDILREHIPDESVDLIYLDPPFNSNRSYNVLFKEANGTPADSQIRAFDDTWSWGQTAQTALREIELGNYDPRVVKMIQSIVDFVGHNYVSAYLVMMTIRLTELHRVLKPTGSIYLHCDPTASHYLKVVMDSIFSPHRFRTEIIWKRSAAHSDTKQGRRQHGRIHDVILFITKSDEWTWNPQYIPYDPGYVQAFYRYVEEGTGRRYRRDNLTAAKPGGDTTYQWWVKRRATSGSVWEADITGEHNEPRPGWEYTAALPYTGRFWAYSYRNMVELARQGRLYHPKSGIPQYKRYLDEMPGVPLQNLWTDIRPASSSERLGYPTQKPLALLERVVQASSNPGDLILDPFCGCGTTICAAQKLGRQWVGIDITHLAISLMRQRLADMFGGEVEYEVVGQPVDAHSARALALQDRFQFEWWALGLIPARPANKRKRGADQGLDGILFFIDEAKKKAKKVAVQVKSGHVQSSQIRDLCSVVVRENAVMGFFVTLQEPTGPMITEALSAGYYHSPGWNRDYQKVQIRTIEQLLDGDKFDMPAANITLARAGRVEQTSSQGELL